MSCEEIRDLLTAVSIGTATAEERRQVEEHLLECDLEHGEVEDAVVAALLAESIEEMTPPAALKGRVMAAALGGAAETAVPPVAPFDRPATRSTAKPGWLRRFVGPYQVAAVLAVALVGMVAWNVQLQSQPEDEKFVHYYWGGDDNWMRMEMDLGEPGAQVSLGGLDHLSDGSTYHLWTTRGDDVIFVGVFNTSDDGRWAGDFDFTFEEGDRVWITAQEGGTGPEGDAVLRTRF